MVPKGGTDDAMQILFNRKRERIFSDLATIEAQQDSDITITNRN